MASDAITATRLQSDLADTIFTEWGRAACLIDPNRLEVWEDLGLTLSQLRVLYLLNRSPGSLAGSIANTLKVRPSTATGIVDRLVRQKLVSRERDESDRRRVQVYLTDRGREVITELRARSRAQIWQILGQFTQSELDHVAEALTMITTEGERQGIIAPWPPDPEVM